MSFKCIDGSVVFEGPKQNKTDLQTTSLVLEPGRSMNWPEGQEVRTILQLSSALVPSLNEPSGHSTHFASSLRPLGLSTQGTRKKPGPQVVRQG